MTKYGYARVSTREQNLDRQIKALADFGIDRLVCDKASGKDFEREGYLRMREALAPGDLVVILSIDRLGRNYDEILEEWRCLTKVIRSDVVVIDMPLLDTRASDDERGITGVFIADLVLQILSYVAQVERENIRLRQREGIDAARERGASLGRPKIKRPRNYWSLTGSIESGEISIRKAASKLKVSRSTLRRWMIEDGVPAAFAPAQCAGAQEGAMDGVPCRQGVLA